MSDMEVVDARGLSCPQPVMLAREAMKRLGKGMFQVQVDSGTARDNVSRTAKNSGWTLSIEEEAGESYRLTLTK